MNEREIFLNNKYINVGQKCLVCDSTSIRKISFEVDKSVTSDNRLVNSPLSHSYCSNCGYIFVDFDKRVDYKKYYCEDYVFLLDGDIEPSLNDRKYSELLTDFFSELIEDKNINSFLDIGAGKGNFVEAIHNRFSSLNIYALEPSRSFQQLRQKSFLKKCYNDFFNSANFEQKFDYLSILGVLEHVPNPKEFLLDIKNIMKKESYLLIEVPNFKNNKSDLLTIDHLSKFTEDTIENLFNICGFRIVKKQVSNNVPMQFIVCIDEKNKKNNKIDIYKTVNSAINYLNNAIDNAKSISNEKIAVYGQGLILNYLIGINVLNIDNICCIIDDNPLYQGRKYQNKIEILSFDSFRAKHPDIKKIFLAMNECYHTRISNRTKKNFGILK